MCALIILFPERGLEILQQTSGFELIHIDEDVAHIMHIRAIDVDLASPLFHVTPLAIDVVAVVVLYSLLPDRRSIIARDVKHGLDHLRDDVFRVHRQELDSLSIVDRDA